jgi:hypothetical protein
MKLDEIVFLIGLLTIPFTFLFASKLFYDKKYFLYLAIFALVSAAIGLMNLSSTDNQKPNFYLFLFCPTYSLLVFRILLYLFRLKLRRNPKDPPKQLFPKEDGLWWDRLFYFTFMTLILCLPILYLTHFYT